MDNERQATGTTGAAGTTAVGGPMCSARLCGPPTHGPEVTIIGPGMRVGIRVDDDDDREILRLALEMGERRRYGRAT